MSILVRVAAVAAVFTLAAPAGLVAQSSKITVTIASGPHAGTYEMQETCEVNPGSYPALYIMAFTTGTTDPKTPSKMEFFTASKKGKPDGFVVSVHFRGGGQDRFEIFAIPQELAPGSAPSLKGRGTVTVKQTPAGSMATFRGQTEEGVRMEGTLDCRSRS